MASIDLLDVTTADGLSPTGALYPAAVSSHKLSGIDAALMVHGNGVSFYSPYQRDFAARLAAMGVAVLAARSAATAWRHGRRGGRSTGTHRTSLERIDERVLWIWTPGWTYCDRADTSASCFGRTAAAP